MAVYAYKGINASGKQVSGVQDAESPRAVKTALKRDGIFATEVKESTLSAQDIKVAGKSGAGGVFGHGGALSFLSGRKSASKAQVSIMTRQPAA